jgi:hypothetical protein
MNTSELKAIALTEKEARYLNDLRSAAKNYRQSLETLQTSAQRDLDRLAAGQHTSGIGGQWITEPVGYHAALKALLEVQYYAYEMEDTDAWQMLCAAAYKEEVDWFHASASK